MSSNSYFTAPEERALTFISSKDGFADDDTFGVHVLQLKAFCVSVKYRKMKDTKIDELAKLAYDMLKACKTRARDVANLSDIEEEEEEDTHPPFIGTAETPTPGKARISTWVDQVSVKAWPRVAWEHTRLTEAEKDKINNMEIIDLYDYVKKEYPERVKKIFPNGYDGMTKTRMQRRVINLLRLHYDELVQMTQTGRSKKAKVAQYLVDVKAMTLDKDGEKVKFFLDA